MLAVLLPSELPENDTDWRQPDFLKYEYYPVVRNEKSEEETTMYGGVSRAVILDPAATFRLVMFPGFSHGVFTEPPSST